MIFHQRAESTGSFKFLQEFKLLSKENLVLLTGFEISQIRLSFCAEVDVTHRFRQRTYTIGRIGRGQSVQFGASEGRSSYGRQVPVGAFQEFYLLARRYWPRNCCRLRGDDGQGTSRRALADISSRLVCGLRFRVSQTVPRYDTRLHDSREHMPLQVHAW